MQLKCFPLVLSKKKKKMRGWIFLDSNVRSDTLVGIHLVNLKDSVGLDQSA